MALDRARLSEIESKRREHEQRSLRSELNDLRAAFQHSKLVYRSAEMERLMTTARRVATTGETVLISGPTGTGKELLAQTIHALSPRRDRLLVVVDCAAIPETLMESELFGHEKGAYTGAHARRKGRLAEAEGGTLLLDEIGELPLQVQSRLLRFAQEKQLTRVGGGRARQVDVRIVAATNRDLYKEVQDGRFREDLYYRLQQLPLEIPPLQERPDDILPLAQHYFEIYRVQYQAPVRRLSEDAKQSLLQHDWPGNVRELQNRLMKAILLCQAEALSPADLELSEKDDQKNAHREPTEPDRNALEPLIDLESSRQGNPIHSSKEPLPQDPRTNLRKDLRALVAQILDARRRRGRDELPPVGRWLQDEFLCAADREAKGRKRLGASLLGIPATTYRRRLPKAKTEREIELRRPDEWKQVRRLVQQLISQNVTDSENLLLLTEQDLLKEIQLHFPDQISAGAKLLGVTSKTFRKRAASFNE